MRDDQLRDPPASNAGPMRPVAQPAKPGSLNSAVSAPASGQVAPVDHVLRPIPVEAAEDHALLAGARIDVLPQHCPQISFIMRLHEGEQAGSGQ